MSCAPTCTETDVLTGLWRISTQLHTLSAYLVLTSIMLTFAVVILAVFAFVLVRRGR